MYVDRHVEKDIFVGIHTTDIHLQLSTYKKKMLTHRYVGTAGPFI
jgi:hypothetical protein